MTDTLPSNRSPFLLQVRDLNVHFPVTQGALFRKHTLWARAVDGVSFNLPRGMTLGVVGESGCGKSTTARAIMHLIKPTSGKILFNGDDLTVLSREQLRQRRRHFQMIFQDPYASLNPRMTVGDIIGEPMKNYGVAHGAELNERVQAILHRVGMNPRYVRRYPHEFSGGQRQRIGIARAIALNPELVIADEPVSALDVSIQAQIINLLIDLKSQENLTYLFISHDLAVVRHISDFIAVMYLGRIVEMASYDDIYTRPQHPYTQALLSAVPLPDPRAERKRKRIVLTGDVPSPLNPPTGCPFHTRCPVAKPICKEIVPMLKEHAPRHAAACHLLDN